jgi:hypothetical protein
MVFLTQRHSKLQKSIVAIGFCIKCHAQIQETCMKYMQSLFLQTCSFCEIRGFTSSAVRHHIAGLVIPDVLKGHMDPLT